VQLTLSFLTSPTNTLAEQPQWTDLAPDARVEAVEILARMMANTVPVQNQQEGPDHD
jgi:hypothetical protein